MICMKTILLNNNLYFVELQPTVHLFFILVHDIQSFTMTLIKIIYVYVYVYMYIIFIRVMVNDCVSCTRI